MYNSFRWTGIAVERNKLTKLFEPLQPFLFMDIAKIINSSIFLDIGANIGVYSLFMSKVSCVNEIHAFEPSPVSFRALQEIVKMNDLRHLIHCHNVALSDANGQIEFGIISETSGANSVIATSIHAGNKRFARTVQVQAASLDTLLPLENETISVKIDVEGHELAVIEGAKSLLSSNTCIIQIENYDNDNSSILDALRAIGYEKILRIGPDYYFLNDLTLIDERTLINSIETSAASMIESNLEVVRASSLSDPLRRKILPGVTIEIGGFCARAARRMRALMMLK